VTASPLPISVVIPAYRRPDEVRRAVASVLGQENARPAEVLVVDDASGDGTAEAAREAGARVIEHSVNRGEGGARNTGIEAAAQPWIALLDSDDEWLPWHLERLWPLRGDHVIVGAACIAVGSDPRAGRIFGWHGRRPKLLESPAQVAWPENILTPSGTLLRRDAVLAVGGFPERLPVAADADTWLRMLELGTALASPAVGVLYHVHQGQASAPPLLARRGLLERYATYSERPWYDRRLPARYAALNAWDERDAGALIRAAAHPQGAIGLAQALAFRFGKRRAGVRRRAELATLGISWAPGS
jgi:glycosyltransferase involved in cell wall biosynthesis